MGCPSAKVLKCYDLQHKKWQTWGETWKGYIICAAGKAICSSCCSSAQDRMEKRTMWHQKNNNSTIQNLFFFSFSYQWINLRPFRSSTEHSSRVQRQWNFCWTHYRKKRIQMKVHRHSDLGLCSEQKRPHATTSPGEVSYTLFPAPLHQNKVCFYRHLFQHQYWL